MNNIMPIIWQCIRNGTNPSKSQFVKVHFLIKCVVKLIYKKKKNPSSLDGVWQVLPTI